MTKRECTWLEILDCVISSVICGVALYMLALILLRGVHCTWGDTGFHCAWGAMQ